MNVSGAAHLVEMARVLDIEIERGLGAAEVAREAVRGALAYQPTELIGMIALLVSELVTNAVVHAASNATVRLDLGRTIIRVEVGDETSDLSNAPGRASTVGGGRGLQIVRQLATRSGWTKLDDGKSVWFEVDLPRAELALS